MHLSPDVAVFSIDAYFYLFAFHFAFVDNIEILNCRLARESRSIAFEERFKVANGVQRNVTEGTKGDSLLLFKSPAFLPVFIEIEFGNATNRDFEESVEILFDWRP